MPIYKGFSTKSGNKKFKINDLNLVKEDLYNHFAIRKGEKLMNPSFGSAIWEMLFEPLTDELKALITEDVQKIVNYDPRVSVDRVIVTELDQAIQVEVYLRLIQTNQTSTMLLNFNQQSKTLTRG